MIKVLQFGEGNFLRTFVDAYFDTLNKEGLGKYGVTIFKPITFGTLEKFEKQNNRYHVILRGVDNGKAAEKVCKIDVIQKAMSPFEDLNGFYAVARDEDLKIIVSNTTEAGICFHAEDNFDGFEHITFPAKLTKFLLKRYRAGLGGVYLLPVELIENNADELKKCVDNYITLWQLPEAFRKWNDEQNFYCNTLVDRIVSGYPKDEDTKKHIEELLGEKDELVSIGEPFGLWAVEKKGDVSRYILEGKHNIEVVLTEDIGYYKKRKVRVLNGSHTNLVPAGLWHGKQTVYDCMQDKKLFAFLDKTLEEEIIPYVSTDTAATAAFADSVKERFNNPYLNHRLLDISLNSVSKWSARNLPSFKDYYAEHKRIPKYLTVGFSYLMQLLVSLKEKDGEYYSQLPSGEVLFKDNEEYLRYFAEGGSVKTFMSDKKVWGEDLTQYRGFYETVKENMEKISRGEELTQF